MLDGLGLSHPEDLRVALRDRDPRVVEHAIDLADRWTAKDSNLREAVHPHLNHADPRVRLAARFALAPVAAAPSRPADRWEQQAILVAAGERGGELLTAVLADPAALTVNVAEPKRFVAEVARLAAASPHEDQHRRALAAMFASAEFQRVALASFFGERRRRGVPFDEALSQLDEADRARLAAATARASTAAQDAASSDEAHCEAIDLAALSPASSPLLVDLALDDVAAAVQQQAVAALVPAAAIEPWQRLIAGFPAASPGVQRAILDGLLTRTERTSLLLDEIAAGRIAPTTIDAARGAVLLNHRDEAVRRRSEKLFAQAVPADRQQVLADYQSALALRGDPMHGREVFSKHCATCHKIGDVGVSFATDISDSREKTLEQLLTAVLQPNRAVDANFFSYTAVTVDGLAVTGLLTAETSTSVTLKEAFDKEATLNRDDIETLSSTGLSLMPEGLEREIPQQHMANLLAFIKNWRYLDKAAPPVAP